LNSIGTLYGIGVGPGDPELLTLKAVNILRRVDVVLAASSSRNEYSIAQDIARPHLHDSVPVVKLDFPMTRDREALETAWKENARIAARELLKGRDAAFLTLGDPMVYSTFGYLARTVARLHPEIPVRVVPGITSFQAAAAGNGVPLVESGENLLILSGVNDAHVLSESLEQADNTVILKSYRNFSAIREVVTQHGLADRSFFVSRIGLSGEVGKCSLSEAPETPSYLSLVVVKKGHDRS
jgi:precorrin-2/cobalt-factor-2 C20-methyltransferase